MTTRRRHLGAGGAALIAAVVLGACGSGGAHPGTPGTATPQPSAPALATTPAAFNATDAAFAAGVLRLENQAAALAALAPAHTTTPEVTQFAAHLREHAGEAQHMRDMMGQWGHSAPPPYTPGATPPTGAGPGMMGAGGWDEMGHMHGGDFNDHFADAMFANRTAEVALCHTELRNGASPQARQQAATMLKERQAELAQLRGWQHQWKQGNDHDSMHGRAASR